MTGGRLAGTALLVRSHLHAGWRGLGLWTTIMSGLVVATGWSITALYPTRADRAAYAESAGASPVLAAFNGRPHQLTEVGNIVSYEVGFLALVGFPVIAIHLAVRLSRHEEDSGRTELVTAGRVGRLAPVTAAALTVGICLAGFVASTAAGLTAAGLPATGAWHYSLALGLFAASSAALGLLAAEVGKESRTAYGVALGVALVAFLVRAGIDGQGWDLAWVSPSGWLAEVRPWTDPQAWPLVAYACLTLACLAAAAAMASRRDLYGGLLAARSGPAYGAPALGTPTGFVWRFTRASLAGWLLGTVLWNAAFGALAGEMTEIARANPTMLAALGVERAEDLVTSLALLLCGVGASAFGVQAMARLAREESNGRLGYVLSTRAARARLWLVWLAVVVGGVVMVLLASSLSLGLFAVWSTGDGSNLGSALGAAAALVLPVVSVVALGAALQGSAPRLAVLAWVAVGWTTVVGLLAETLRLPEWARDLSPLHAVGNVPIEDPNAAALVVTALLAASLVACGVARFRRRDLLTG